MLYAANKHGIFMWPSGNCSLKWGRHGFDGGESTNGCSGLVNLNTKQK